MIDKNSIKFYSNLLSILVPDSQTDKQTDLQIIKQTDTTKAL